MENNTYTTTNTTTTVTSSSRKFTVIVLFVLLTVMAAVGIIVAISLQGTQAPDDSLAWEPGPVCDPGYILCGGGTTCDAGRGCIPESLVYGAGGCQAYINSVCNTGTCAGDGASPPGGQQCCDGLVLCGNNVCTTQAVCDNLGTGNDGANKCFSQEWNVYRCNTCNLGGGSAGCQGTPIARVTNCETASCAAIQTHLNQTPLCGVTQIDCIRVPADPFQSVLFVTRRNCSSDGTCTPGGSTDEPPGTGEPNPFCGDAICATNELCERTSPGGSSFRACRAGDIGSTPGGQVVSECYRLTDGTNQVAGTGPRCKFCGDGLFHAAEEQCDGTAPAGNGNDPTNCSSTCNIKVRECLGVNRSATTLAPGVGNKTIFTLRFRDERSLYPYDPGVAMRVSSGSSTETAVGRDANNTSSTLVSLIPGAAGKSRAQQADGSYIYEYKFEWEAANSAGTDVAAGTYTVQFLNNGNPLFEGVAACQSTITISEEQVENPLFTIVKLSTPVCESDNDSRIDYTVRVTNTGPVEGVIDFVRDTLDADVIAAGIVPTAIVPAYGIYGSGQITWTGTVADRTYASLQAKDFTYSVTIPASLVSSFTATGIDNQVVVQYDTEDTDDNTDSFTLNTPITCGTTVVVIPVTGILDDGRFLILGALFVLTGIYVYRRQYVLEHSFETEIERKLSRKADEQD